MIARSNRADVRNPMVQLDEFQALRDLPPEVNAKVVACFKAISAAARPKAEQLWRKHKAPMAAYWKAKAVDFRHMALAARVRP